MRAEVQLPSRAGSLTTFGMTIMCLFEPYGVGHTQVYLTPRWSAGKDVVAALAFWYHVGQGAAVKVCGAGSPAVALCQFTSVGVEDCVCARKNSPHLLRFHGCLLCVGRVGS